MQQEAKSFIAPISLHVNWDYLLYLPSDYDSRADWPLILYLHDHAEDEDRMALVKDHGLPRHIRGGDELAFVVCAPLCPEQHFWPEVTPQLNALLDHMVEDHRVDPQRIYLTGIGMGAYGTWSLASRYPQRFAAIAPVCGGGGWWMVERLAHMPTWAFHANAVDVVPLIESKIMVKRIREAGGQAQFTVFPGSEAEASDLTYENPALYDWFLAHRR
jgi:predicted peptidase